jgi:hypothetical protein
MSSVSKRLALAWGAFHLSAVLIGVFQIEREVVNSGVVGRLLNLYGRFSGARGGFAFFSVNIPNQLTVEYLVEEVDQPPKRIDLAREFSGPLAGEMRIRYNRMIRALESRYMDEPMRRAVAASLAAAVLDRFYQAHRVTLIAKVTLTTNLADYEGGSPNSEVEVYRASFERTRLTAKDDQP